MECMEDGVGEQQPSCAPTQKHFEQGRGGGGSLFVISAPHVSCLGVEATKKGAPDAAAPGAAS